MRKLLTILAFFACVWAYAGDEYIAQHWGVEDGLSQNTVTTILQDRQGYMWFGTWNGLNRFDGYDFRVYHPSVDGASNSRVTSLYEDEQERLWWTTYGGSLYSLNRNRTRIEEHDMADMPEAMRLLIAHRQDTLFVDRQDIIWRIDDEPGISRLRCGQWRRLTPPIDERFRGTAGRNRVMLYDRDGRLWVNPTGGGFGYYDPERDEIVNVLRCTNTIHTAYFDREGMLWVSSYDKGIECLDFSDQPYRVHDLSVWGKKLGEVRAMHADEDGQITLISRDERLVYCIEQTRRGMLYGTRNSGIRYADGRPAPYPTRSPHIYDMMSVGDTLVVATRGGGIHIFMPNGKRLVLADGARVRCLARSGDTLFAGTTDGVLRYHRDLPLRRIGRGDIRCLTVMDGRVWAGSFGAGLLRVEDSTLVRVNTGEDIVTAMVGLDGKLYMTSETGITRYDVSTGEHTYYNPLEKSRQAYFTEAKALCRPDSVILFGFSQGYVEFNPRKVRPLGKPAPLRVLGIRSQDSIYAPGTDSIELEYGEGAFTVSYAALEYSNPDHVQYMYMLDGYDRDWHRVGRARVASYANLSPGRYIFRLRSTNRAGEWIDNEQRLTIVVAQSVWLSWWMWIAYALAIMVVLVGASHISRRHERLKQEIVKGEEVNSAKLQFFTNISHELRTPLTLICGPVENLLRYENLSKQARQQLEIVQANSQRMLRMVNQILDFRKIQNNKMRLRVQLTSLMDVVRTTTGNFTKEASDRNINLQMKQHATDDVIWCDRQQVDTLAFNLLSNAFKYTPDGKTITISVDERPDFVLLVVSDEGIGISHDRIGHIFDRFSSHSDANMPTNRPGTGIGLNLVRDIVELHHGFVEVESSPGRGATFTVMFLRGKDHFANDVDFVIDDAMSAVPSDSADGERDYSQPRQERDVIMVVDDNADMRTYLRTILQTQYEVLQAADGIEALPMIRQHQPALVITDLMMPNMDGLQLTQRIKTDTELSHIPVILLTAKSAIESRLQAMGIGADDYLTKPFEADYLMARTQNIITQRRQLEKSYRERLLRMEPHAERHRESPEEEFLYRLHAVMEKQMDNNGLTVDMLVEEMNLGRTVFFNRLKGLTGLSPVEFIRDIRIKRAAKLLQDPRLNISEVTYMVGMNDSRYFSKCFKQVYGITPTEYKRQHGNSNSINE